MGDKNIGRISGLGFYLEFVLKDLFAAGNFLVPISVFLSISLTTAYSTIGLAMPEWSEKSRKLEISRSASLSLTLIPGFGQGIDGNFLDQLYREFDAISTEHVRLIEPFVQQDFRIQFPEGHPQNGRRISARLMQDRYLWRGVVIGKNHVEKLKPEEISRIRTFCDGNQFNFADNLKGNISVLLPDSILARDSAWWRDMVFPSLDQILGIGFAEQRLEGVPEKNQEWSLCLNGKKLVSGETITDTFQIFPAKDDLSGGGPAKQPFVIISADMARILGPENCEKGKVIYLSTPNTPDFFPSLEFRVGGVLDDSQPSSDQLYFRMDEVRDYLQHKKKENIPVERIIAKNIPKGKSVSCETSLNKDPEFQEVMKDYGLRDPFVVGDALVLALEEGISSRDKYLWQTRIQSVASKSFTKVIGEESSRKIHWEYVPGKGDPTESGYTLSPRTSKYEVYVQSVESLTKVEKSIQKALSNYKEFKWLTENAAGRKPDSIKLFDPPSIGNTELIRQVEEVEKSFNKAQSWMDKFVTASFVVLVFIMLVLFFLRFEKKKAEISLLKVIGNSPVRLSMLPVIQGLVLGIFASLVGFGCGILALEFFVVGSLDVQLVNLSGFWLKIAFILIVFSILSALISMCAFKIVSWRAPAALINEH